MKFVDVRTKKGRVMLAFIGGMLAGSWLTMFVIAVTSANGEDDEI